MKYFEHELPCDPSSMTRWRKRIGEAGAEELLKKTINAGLVLKAVKKTQLRNINVDTTVQKKMFGSRRMRGCMIGPEPDW